MCHGVILYQHATSTPELPLISRMRINSFLLYLHAIHMFIVKIGVIFVLGQFSFFLICSSAPKHATTC